MVRTFAQPVKFTVASRVGLSCFFCLLNTMIFFEPPLIKIAAAGARRLSVSVGGPVFVKYSLSQTGILVSN